MSENAVELVDNQSRRSDVVNEASSSENKQELVSSQNIDHTETNAALSPNITAGRRRLAEKTVSFGSPFISILAHAMFTVIIVDVFRRPNSLKHHWLPKMISIATALGRCLQEHWPYPSPKYVYESDPFDFCRAG